MLHDPASVSVHIHNSQFPVLLCFDLPSRLLLRHLERAFKALFLFHSSGLWEKIAVQTTDVRSDPRPPLPFSRNGMFPTLWHNFNKGDILKEHSWSFVQPGIISSPLCVSVLMETSHLKSPLRFCCFDSYCDRIKAMALPTVTTEHACLCVWMPVHIPSHQQVSHTGSVTIDLLRRQENGLITACIPTLHRNNLFLNKIGWR